MNGDEKRATAPAEATEPAEAKLNVTEVPTAKAPNAGMAEPLSGAPSMATMTSPSWTPARAACEGQG